MENSGAAGCEEKVKMIYVMEEEKARKDHVLLLMWASTSKVLSRMTPRLLTLGGWGECRAVSG